MGKIILLVVLICGVDEQKCRAPHQVFSVGGTVLPSDVGKSPHWREHLSCGVSSCYMLLRLRGHEISYEEVKRLVPIVQNGSSLAAMKHACNHLGLEVENVLAKPSDCSSLRWPAIAHLRDETSEDSNSGHYVVILAVKGRHISIIDPTAGHPQKILRGDFFRRWSGHLLIPRDGLPASGGILSLASTRAVVFSATIILLLTLLALRWRLNKGLQSARVAIVLCTLVVIEGGCSKSESIFGPVHETDFHTAGNLRKRENLTFDLTAWELDKHVGYLFDGEEKSGRFRIENTGRADVHIDVGQPSCKCSSINIDRKNPSPGETAVLEMTLANHGSVGPLSASVQVVAVGQPWGNTFSIHGYGLGSYFPPIEMIFDRKSKRPSRVIEGRVISLHADDSCDIVAKLAGNNELANLLTVGSPELSDIEEHDDYFGRKILIPIQCSMQRQNKLKSPVSGKVIICVSVCGHQRKHLINIRIQGGDVAAAGSKEMQ